MKIAIKHISSLSETTLFSPAVCFGREKSALFRLVGGQWIDHNDWASVRSKLLVRSENCHPLEFKKHVNEKIIVNIVVNWLRHPGFDIY